jgi:hypothetical protein
VGKGGFPGFRIRMMCATFHWEGEVVEKQDGIEELGEKFVADSGQYFEDFTGDEVVARGFFWD